MSRMIRLQLHFKLALLATLFFGFVGFSHAQELTGTIVDAESGEPLFGASVVITGTAVGGTADFDGNFKFKPGQQPPFKVTVSYIGYQNQEIEVTSFQPLTIKVCPNPNGAFT